MINDDTLTGASILHMTHFYDETLNIPKDFQRAFFREKYNLLAKDNVPDRYSLLEAFVEYEKNRLQKTYGKNKLDDETWEKIINCLEGHANYLNYNRDKNGIAKDILFSDTNEKKRIIEYYEKMDFIRVDNGIYDFSHKIYQDFFFIRYCLKHYPNEIPLFSKMDFRMMSLIHKI